jgi:hypothetical protein
MAPNGCTCAANSPHPDVERHTFPARAAEGSRLGGAGLHYPASRIRALTRADEGESPHPWTPRSKADLRSLRVEPTDFLCALHAEITTHPENTTRGDGATCRDGKIVNMTASVDRLPVVEGVDGRNATLPTPGQRRSRTGSQQRRVLPKLLRRCRSLQVDSPEPKRLSQRDDQTTAQYDSS